MTFSFQTVRPDAAEAACAVVRRSIIACCFQDHGGNARVVEAWLNNKTPDNFRAWLTSPQSIAVGAFDDALLVGMALVTDSALLLCYVAPEALHKGTGQRLLSFVESLARDTGLHQIELESTRTAYDFYIRNGYAPSGPPQYWAGMRAFPMRKPLARGLL